MKTTRPLCGVLNIALALAGRVSASSILPLLLLLMLPAVVQAQFNYTNTNGTITITGYTGPWGAVTIPSTINGLPVTSIGDWAFANCTSLTSVTIGNSNGLPVTSIGDWAFANCTSLTNVTIGNSVTNIGNYAFAYCASLTGVYFQANAPSVGSDVFGGDNNATVYYLPGTTGWGATFAGRPAGLWNFNFTTTNGTITITGYAGPGGPVVIPSVVNGLPVTSIGGYAFQVCTSLTSVTIPNSVTSIGFAAFFDCTSLTNLTIGTSVTSIGQYAFNYCTSLTSVTIPGSVTNIGDNAFQHCSSLTSVTIGNGVTTIGQEAFAYCPSLTSVTIPNSVTSVGGYAFRGCTSLTSVTIGNSVTSIGDYALLDCTRLASVTIPNSVTSIGNGAFYGCISLISVTIGNSVTNIGKYAFAYCASLTGVYFQGNAPGVGSDVFDGDNHATVYYLPGTTGWGATFAGRPAVLWKPPVQGYTYTTTNGAVTITGYTGPGGPVVIPGVVNGLPVTSIGNGAFERCSGLTSVTIPNSVTSIGDWAFESCSSLISVTIGNSVTNIGDGAFGACTSLTSVTIPNSVTNIGFGAFDSCSSLSSVTIGNGVTTIGQKAFAYCPSLTSVTIPNSVTSIGYSAFPGCTKLSAITVDALNSVYSSVEGVLFNKGQTTLIQCPGGKAGSYTIPNGVTGIGDYAFGGCASLTSVTIPNSVTSIGDDAFGGCISLISVTIGNSVTNIGDGAFGACTSLTSVTIPNSVTNIGFGAFDSCSSLSSVTIGNGVTTIGQKAFAYCPSLTSVSFQGNAPNADSSVFTGDNKATVYYLPGTTGWGATVGGRPTMPWPQPPSILTPPSTQTAEMGSFAFFSVEVTNTLPGATCYQWCFNGTNALGGATNSCLVLASVQPAQAGAYTVVVTDTYGAVTSAPALLSVIPPVERRIVPALYLTGDVGSLLHLDYVNALGLGAPWLSLTNFTLLSTQQLCLDLSDPLPAQRFYRACQTNVPSARSVLDPRLATEIPLTGEVGSSVRIDYINQFGPANAWVTLDTVTLTNSPQLYFDVTMFRQPTRLYRLVAVP